jgi:protein arginine kinase activator
MTCQICKQNPASIQVYELHEEPDAPPGPAGTRIEKQSVCESCAKTLDLPYLPVKAISIDLWSLLQAAKPRQEADTEACPECGMTLAEFRSRGRLGCANDYELFQAHVSPLLERIHNADEHHGRRPGVAEPEPDSSSQVEALRVELEDAIQAEQYERAAELRDQLSALERGK